MEHSPRRCAQLFRILTKCKRARFSAGRWGLTRPPAACQAALAKTKGMWSGGREQTPTFERTGREEALIWSALCSSSGVLCRMPPLTLRSLKSACVQDRQWPFTLPDVHPPATSVTGFDLALLRSILPDHAICNPLKFRSTLIIINNFN